MANLSSPDLDTLRNYIARLQNSPFVAEQPQETAGIAELQRLTDVEDLLKAARSQFETTASPEIMARLTASGFGRSGAVGEALSKGFANLILPIQQAAFTARSNLGQARLNLGQNVASRGQATILAIIQAQALLERMGFTREQAAANAERFAEQLALQARALGLQESQLGQQESQFARTFGLNERELAQRQEQFGRTFGLSERELAQNAALFNQRLAFDTNRLTGGFQRSPFTYSPESQQVSNLARLALFGAPGAGTSASTPVGFGTGRFFDNPGPTVTVRPDAKGITGGGEGPLNRSPFDNPDLIESLRFRQSLEPVGAEFGFE